jgi:hypothetical protein
LRLFEKPFQPLVLNATSISKQPKKLRSSNESVVSGHSGASSW